MDKNSATGCSDSLLTGLAQEVETAACSSGGAAASAIFKSPISGAASINTHASIFNLLCCLAGMTFEFIGPEGPYAPVPDYGTTPPTTGWMNTGWNPVGGQCHCEQFECNEQVKTVIYIGLDCSVSVKQYCKSRCRIASMDCGGYSPATACPASPPSPCLPGAVTFRPGGGSPGWTLCVRP